MAVAWLALSMLAAQLAGFGHRIAHPHGLAGGIAQVAPSNRGHAPQHLHHLGHVHHEHDAAAGGDVDGAHDCAAYDAATLGDGPPKPAVITAAAPPPSAALGPLGLTQPGSAPQLGFRSRAPPRA